MARSARGPRRRRKPSRFAISPIAFALALVLTTPAFSRASDLGPSLRFLRALQGETLPVKADGPASRARAAATRVEGARVSIRFDTPPSTVRLVELESLGVLFETVDGRRLGSNTVYPATVPWDLLDELAEQPDVRRVESCWRPHPQAPLDVSRPQVETEIIWTLHDERKRRITGEGVVIADFDTGIDVFHPAFWRADGDTVRWLDVNRNGVFDPGLDCVDWNGDGEGGADEVLAYVEAPSHVGLENDPKTYQPSIDWLFHDADADGVRDYGPGAGFGENDPTYGERVLIALDADRDDRLDPDEKLVALGTCKVRAVYQTDGVIRRRGIDLIHSEGDYWNHGTPVAGILAGGVPGVHRLAGLAPGVELLMGNNVYIDEPPFIVTLETLIPWAAQEGADVMLYEDGEWVWSYLDGSSNVEIMMNEMAERGIVQIVPAGNLSSSRMHMQGSPAPGETITARISSTTAPSSPFVSELWPTILWRGKPSEIGLTIVTPDGDRLPVDASGDYDVAGVFRVYSYVSVSPRGTARIDLHAVASDPARRLNGVWDLEITNTGERDVTVHGYIWDDVSSWNGVARWNTYIADKVTTVTWPATADSAIVVGAYSSRGEQILSASSGRGPRIDGRTAIDVTAPGNLVYAPLRRDDVGEPGGFTAFGGTSAAAPHVAAAAAMLRQLWPEADHDNVRQAIRKGSVRDENTGMTPNRDWGYGKLRALPMFDPFASLLAGIGAGDESSRPISLLPMRLHPNPSPGGFEAAFRLAEPGRLRLELFDVTGRRVALLHDATVGAGARTIRWPVDAEPERLLPPGAYFLRAVHEPSGAGPSASRVAVEKLLITR